MTALADLGTDRSRESGPSRRRARAQISTACVIVGIGAGSVPIVAGGAPVHPQLLLAGAAIVALAAGLFGWAPGFTFAALALAGEYSLRLVSLDRGNRIDGWAVVEAVVVSATVELGLRALEARTIARAERRVRRSALLRLVAMVAGAGFSAFAVLAVGGRRLPAPTTGLALGLAAAAALLLSADRLRRRATR
jgi:hypothetical protein